MNDIATLTNGKQYPLHEVSLLTTVLKSMAKNHLAELLGLVKIANGLDHKLSKDVLQSLVARKLVIEKGGTYIVPDNVLHILQTTVLFNNNEITIQDPIVRTN